MASKAPPAPARRSAPTPARRSPPPPPPRRASGPAPTPPTPTSRAAAPAAAAAAPAAATTVAKPPRKRSAPMGRAVKFCRLADKNLGRVLRLVGNWRGEATPEQKKINDEIVTQLKAAAPLVERALLDVGLLADSKFIPIEARGRAITEPFAAGEHVIIGEKHYKPLLHGVSNDFEVVVQVENMVKLRPFGDLKGAQLIVPRGQLTGFEDPEEEEEGEEEEGGEEERAEGEAPEGEEAIVDEADSNGDDPAPLNFDE